MTVQLDLFPPARVVTTNDKVVTALARDKVAAMRSDDHRKLVRVLNASAKGGLVNGMSKAQLRRYAPARLPPITVPKG